MTPVVVTSIRERNWLIGLVGAGHLFSHFVMLALPPLFLLIKQEMGVSYVALGGVVSVMATMSAVGQIPMGFLVDRIGGRFVLLGGMALMSVCLLLVGFSSSYWTLFVLFAVAGIGNSVFHPADYAILSARLDESVHGRAFSIHSFTGYLGWACAALVMLPLGNAIGWRLSIVVVGMAGLLITAAMAVGSRYLDDRHSSPQADRSANRKPNGWRAGTSLMVSFPILMLFTFFALSVTATAGIMTFSIPANVALYGLDDVTASLALTAHLVACAAGVLVGGWLADLTARHNIVTALAIISMAVSVLLLAMEGAILIIMASSMILSGLFYGISSPSRDILIKKATPAGLEGVAFGFTSTGMSLGNLLGPLLCGWIMDAGEPRLMYVVLAAIIALSVITVGLTRSHATKS